MRKTNFPNGLWCLLILWGLMGQAWADRALIVGVGKYQNANLNLPGVDLDVAMMEEAALLMGYKKGEIRLLRDEQATSSKVKAAIEEWLIQGVSPSDRTLFYFSGHGHYIKDQNKDEKDKQDEVWVTYDVQFVDDTLKNVLVDDDFNLLLEKIPSKNTLIMIDACHSGTSYKSISLGFRSLGDASKGVVKTFTYPGMSSHRSFVARKKKKNNKKNVNYVALTAARDNEKAIATEQGSVFTLGFLETIKQSVHQGESITLDEIHRRVDRYVGKALTGPQRFHPQISGNRELILKPLHFRKVSVDDSPAWSRLANAVDQVAERMDIELNQRRFRLGDSLVISVHVTHEGYLNVVNLGPDGNPIVLFPNDFHQDNQVSSGTLTLPTPQMGFDFIAEEPAGETLIVAFLSKDPLNLHQKGFGKDAFHLLSPLGIKEIQTRAFGVQKRKNKNSRFISAGKATTKISR